MWTALHEEIQPPALELLQMWIGLRRGRAIPDAALIDPLRFRRWIGNINIMHVTEGPKTFFVALQCSNTASQIGESYHRRYLEDCVPPHAYRHAMQPYWLCLERRRPVYSLLLPGALTGNFERLDRLVLPFGQDEERPSRFMIWVGPSCRDPWEADSVYGDHGSTTDSEEPGENEKLIVIDPDSPGGSERVSPFGLGEFDHQPKRRRLFGGLSLLLRERQPFGSGDAVLGA